jgi:hypothetical protein
MSQVSPAELTERPGGVTLEAATAACDHPVLCLIPDHPHEMRGGFLSMAKALLGYVGGDSRLLDENQRLRRRIADLQMVVLRLQAENDALAAELHRGELLTVPDTISDKATASL